MISKRTRPGAGGRPFVGGVAGLASLRHVLIPGRLMGHTVADAVTHALPRVVDDQAAAVVDLGALEHELEEVAEEVLTARQSGIPLPKAVADDSFPVLRAFHQGLRDALLLEIPGELRHWVEHVAAPPTAMPSLTELSGVLVGLARTNERSQAPIDVPLQRALAELLVFEAVRLRLLVAMWSSEDFESVGGEESDIDAIAWSEVETFLADPDVRAPEVRPLHLMFASASVALARDAALRAESLRRSGADLRSELKMRARLRGALRELRLPESVLLENALSTLLGEDRRELSALQEERPVALEGMSRQAMDQRVSRGRRALSRTNLEWPRRRSPALFDLMRGAMVR